MARQARRSRRSRRAASVGRVLLVAGAAWGVAAAWTQAQTPANIDRGLEAKVYAGTNEPPRWRRPNFADEVRMRNAIVTGNAPGGRSFRGDVGYTGEFDFRGVLASDATFRFRRDSAGVSTGFRGAEPLQYQYALTTGNAFTPISRTEGQMRTPGGLQANVGWSQTERLSARRSNEVDPTSIDAQVTPRASTGFNLMRSSSGFAATQTLAPVVVGTRRSSVGVESLTASSLLGVRSAVDRYRRQAVGDAIRTRESGPTNVPRESVNPFSAVPAGPASAQGATPADGSFRTGYETLRERAASAPRERVGRAEDPQEATAAQKVDRRLDELRKYLSEAEEDRQARSRPLRGSTARGGKADEAKADGAKSGPGARFEGARREGEPTAGLTDQTFEALRALGGPVGGFARGSFDSSDVFAGHMSAASTLLAQGRYFDAEERFARGLSLRPGEPTAMAGRLHAQIGAGLFLSAAVNLRTMLQQYPELSAVRWGAEALPTPARLDAVAASLSEAARGEGFAGTGAGDASLLLAYIAYQRGDVEAALRALDGVDAAANADGGDAGDALAGVLRRVWTPEPAAGTPAGGTP